MSKPQKLLMLGLYGPLAASTRYRLLQYQPALEAAGYHVDFSHLLGDTYLKRRFAAQRPSAITLARAVTSRLRVLSRQRDYDAAILHCELFPFLPGQIERSMLRIPYLYDFDDAFYLKYGGDTADSDEESNHPNGEQPGQTPGNWILGRKFQHVINGATAVAAGNRTLAEFALRFNRNVTLMPTVVDTDRYEAREKVPGTPVNIGWIGSPSTAPFLDIVLPALQRLDPGAVKLTVIGAEPPAAPGVNVHARPWQAQTEIDEINGFDIGIMPLPDDAWARGKCAFKLIQCMACGVPVIGSAVGANMDVITPESGLTASTTDDWVAAIKKLAADPGLRRQMGVAARDRIVEKYSLQCQRDRYVDTVHGLLS